LDIVVVCVLIPPMVDRFGQHNHIVNTEQKRTFSTGVNVEELKRRLEDERKKDKTKIFWLRLPQYQRSQYLVLYFHFNIVFLTIASDISRRKTKLKFQRSLE